MKTRKSPIEIAFYLINRFNAFTLFAVNILDKLAFPVFAFLIVLRISGVAVFPWLVILLPVLLSVVAFSMFREDLK